MFYVAEVNALEQDLTGLLHPTYGWQGPYRATAAEAHQDALRIVASCTTLADVLDLDHAPYVHAMLPPSALVHSAAVVRYRPEQDPRTRGGTYPGEWDDQWRGPYVVKRAAAELVQGRAS